MTIPVKLIIPNLSGIGEFIWPFLIQFLVTIQVKLLTPIKKHLSIPICLFFVLNNTTLRKV